MLRADTRVVQTGRDRVRLDGLAVVVLEHVGAGTVEHAGATGHDRGGVPAGLDAARTEVFLAPFGVNQRNGCLR